MTSRYVRAIRSSGVSNLTRTENEAVAYKSTGSKLLDLYAKAGAIRDSADVEQMFQLAFAEDRLLATKLMFYTRNIRGGLGERKTFRKMLRSLANSNPAIVDMNIELIPFYGRYDDLYSLIGTPVENSMWAYLAYTIVTDLEKMEHGQPVSLCAKWLKSINTSSKTSVELGRQTAKQFHMSEKQYRRTLSALRGYLDIAERNMSARAWGKIVYKNVPSYAMKNYRKAFGKHDQERFAEYITKVSTGEEKIHSGTLYPYDILEAAGLLTSYHDMYWGGSRHFHINHDPVLEEQWKALPDYINGDYNVLAMSDTSGSMYSNDNGRPLATSLALAIYLAERNKGAYHNLFLTFSESPRFVELQGKTLAEKVSHIEAIVENTDLEKAFDLILDVAIKNHIPAEEMPKALIVLSDMQFDEARQTRYSYRYEKQPVFHQSMVDKFHRAGYEMPQVIYWNLHDRGGTIQSKADEEGVLLVSGNSASTFKSVLESIGKTPYDHMLDVLNSELYARVRVE